MGTCTLLESIPDRRRICVMLRADGWSYEEISEFLAINVRQVRYEIEHAVDQFPGILDHRRADNQNRMMRLTYCLGASDAGVPVEELPEMLDGLVVRSEWLRERMAARERLRKQVA